LLQSTAKAASMKSILLVMAGGGVGAALRFQLGRLVPVGADGWPLGTFAANVVGGLAMGMLAAWLARAGAMGENMRLLLGVGLLGGFTTFSAFSLDMMVMIERGAVGMAFAYAIISVLLALAALFIGMSLTRMVLA
jgi:fluoride exporter